jgi:hypothetical protein
MMKTPQNHKEVKDTPEAEHGLAVFGREQCMILTAMLMSENR